MKTNKHKYSKEIKTKLNLLYLGEAANNLDFIDSGRSRNSDGLSFWEFSGDGLLKKKDYDVNKQ